MSAPTSPSLPPSSAPPDELNSVFQQANHQAAGWGSPREAGAARARPWLRHLGIAGLGALALAALATQFNGAPLGQAVSGIAGVATAVVPGLAPAAMPTTPAGTEAIRWEGQELVLTLHELPLPTAVKLLAQVTNTPVSGALLLQTPTPVSLNGRFSDVAIAWRYLLQGRAQYSSRCEASGCTVWITGEGAAVAATPVPGATRAPNAHEPGGEAKVPGEVESQPDGSC